MNRRKLRVASETVRTLSGPALRGVAGGRTPQITLVTYWECAPDTSDCPSETTVVATTVRCK